MAVTLDDLDRSRALRTPAEWRQLVEAIRDSPPDTRETNWVEWKSSLDLSSKEGRFSIARAVLGFANRDVKVAGRAFEGVAYMVVGAEVGAVPGVKVIDHAALEQGIRAYLDGPRWAPHYVRVDGKNVLVVVIEAPREGDTIHTLLKEFTPDDRSESSGEKSKKRTVNRPGTIYHRGTARTEQAAPAEIEMLVQRAVDGFREPALELDVSMSASHLVRLDTRPAALTEFGSAGKGTYADLSGERLVIDVTTVRGGNWDAVTRPLAHEMGHALHKMPENLTADDWLTGEGHAVPNEMKVRDEIASSGGPDIGFSGDHNEGDRAEFLRLYGDWQSGRITQQQAAYGIGQRHAYYNPSTCPSINYRTYYESGCP